MFNAIKEILNTRSQEQFGCEQVLKEFDIGEEGINFEELKTIFKKIDMCVPNTNEYKFLSQLFGGMNEIALFGDFFASVLNLPMHTHKSSGVAIEIEKKVISEFCKKSSMGDGIISPGGSISNLMGLIMARDEKLPHIKEKGLRENLVAYTSNQGHYSIRKNVSITGIGKDNLREIKTDDNLKIDVVALEKQIREDKQNGFIPFFINLTAGTTLAGAFDNIKDVARIAKRENIWVHVDAAFGGGVLFSDKKYLLEGINQANSVTIDAHKMLGVPLTCSIILVKTKGLLERSFSEDAEYLFSCDDDPGMKTIQCARRNDALKIWTFLKFYGYDEISKRINKQFELASIVKKLVEDDPSFELALVPEHINVCFSVKDKDVKEICERLNEEGYKIGYGYINNRKVIKFACVNPNLKKEDVVEILEKIKS